MKKALFLTTCGAGLVLNQAGGIRPDGDLSATRRASEAARLQDFYFSEVLTEDDTVTILEAGGFKLTASCKTVTQTFPHFGFYSTTTSTHTSPPSSSGISSSRVPQDGAGGSSGGGDPVPFSSSDNPRPRARTTDGGDGSSSGSGGDASARVGPWRDPKNVPDSMTYTRYASSAGEYDLQDQGDRSRETGPCGSTRRSEDGADSSYGSEGEYGSDYNDLYPEMESNFTESFAALELTYTASSNDYLYGFPIYQNYPDDGVVAGAYEPGESRTQIVYTGRIGGPGGSSSFQSMTGRFLSINGDRTVGIHRSFLEEIDSMSSSDYLDAPAVAKIHSFPEGVDCMVAGVITYVGEAEQPFKIM